MFDKLLHLYQFVDQTMDMLFKKFPKEVQCGTGCTDCCNAVFDLSAIEALYLLKVFSNQDAAVQQQVLDRCVTALQQWQKLMDKGGDPSTARILCPLLNEQGRCSCYEARPINCRTYGVPTVINGAAHVCGLSKFTKGKSYPTLDLAPLQKSLLEYSIESCGDSLGKKRWPVAHLLLHPQELR